MTDVTRDAYLGGRIALWQPAKGYRAGIDPVLLASACPARPGDTVLELGCGIGTASLCLASRVEDLSITGLERQADIADIARRNATETGLPFEVFTTDLHDLSPDLRQRSWHHVIANPPYFDRATSVASTHMAREAAMGEDTPLSAWIECAAKRLRPKGWLTMIQRAERLADVMIALEGRLGSLQIQPLAPRQGRPANLILVRARKSGRASLQLFSPITLHRGTHHQSDQDDYTKEISDVLRGGAAFPGFGD